VSKLPIAARIYVVLLSTSGLALAALAAVRIPHAVAYECLPFILLSALASTMRVRLLPLALRSRSEQSGAAEMSVAFAFTFTAVLLGSHHPDALGGAYPGALAGLASGLASSLLFTSRRHPLYRIAFNGASLVWSAWIAALVLARFGPASSGGPLWRTVLALAGSTYAYYLVNTMSVAGAVSLTQRIPFWSTWSEGFLWTAAPGYFVGALAAAGIAYYYGQVHLLSFAVTLPALYLSYRSYKAYIGKVEETQTRLEEVQALYKESLQLVTQAEKLASIGRLAGGVAHEINNPLMVILGRAELALMDVPEDHASAADLEIIISETKRIANIVKNLLRFSRQDQQDSLLPIDVNETVDRAVELTRYQLTVDNIVVETRYASGLPTVMGNAGQIQQVCTNIIINAYQAMGVRGGRLLIETVRAVDQVEIRFSDSGCGIPADHLKRIFEPFYTTKAEHEGTGLGLAVSYGIIADHGGSITVDSVVGQGSQFTVHLPTAAPIPLADGVLGADPGIALVGTR
jgi:signal transduction histidine kinase